MRCEAAGMFHSALTEIRISDRTSQNYASLKLKLSLQNHRASDLARSERRISRHIGEIGSQGRLLYDMRACAQWHSERVLRVQVDPVITLGENSRVGVRVSFAVRPLQLQSSRMSLRIYCLI